jgi:hypothetical protein
MLLPARLKMFSLAFVLFAWQNALPVSQVCVRKTAANPAMN